MAIFSALTWLALSSAVLAAPSLEPRQTISALSPSQIAAFAPFTHYAAATGCVPASTLAWDCGAHCQANPTFEPVASGGDGSLVQFWNVGFDPTLNTVIVAYQGTDVTKILPVLTDLDIILESLDPVLFPGISPAVKTHAGFMNAHARSAKQVLTAVDTTISKFGASHVTIVGHSLGAALALLDSVYLPLHLPSSIVFKTVGYGMPMVGNQAFADYVDAHVSDVSHVNNKKDPIPTLPGHILATTIRLGRYISPKTTRGKYVHAKTTRAIFARLAMYRTFSKATWTTTADRMAASRWDAERLRRNEKAGRHANKKNKFIS